MPSDMIVIPLVQQQRYAVVGSPTCFAKHGRPRSPAVLLNHQCIRFPNGAIYPWHFKRAGEVTRLDVRCQLTLDESSVAKAVVQEGSG